MARPFGSARAIPGPWTHDPSATRTCDITPIGFGAWALGGGDWQFGWGSQEDQDSIAAIHAALELGVNWIDTAAVYGLGHSEEVVARALADWKGDASLCFHQMRHGLG